jgi:hypothetical protein
LVVTPNTNAELMPAARALIAELQAGQAKA